MSYTFKKIENATYMGGGKLCEIYDAFPERALALGQLKTLFGEPMYITEDYENQFSYDIEAIDETGVVCQLSAYSGPTGPSIGGARGEEVEKAARALAVYIRQATATDYEYEGYYLDAPCKIRMGVRNGVPYAQEEELHLSDEELRELFHRIG